MSIITIVHPRTKRHYTLEHNGIVYDMGMNIASPIIKKAHIMVRRYLLNQWRRTRCNAETSVIVMADGNKIGRVYGYHRDRNIHIIHQ